VPRASGAKVLLPVISLEHTAGPGALVTESKRPADLDSVECFHGGTVSPLALGAAGVCSADLLLAAAVDSRRLWVHGQPD